MTKIIDFNKHKKQDDINTGIECVDEETIIACCINCDGAHFHIREDYTVFCADCWRITIKSYEPNEIIFTPDFEDEE